MHGMFRHLQKLMLCTPSGYATEEKIYDGEISLFSCSFLKQDYVVTSGVGLGGDAMLT